jgi:hypothetical protein
MLRFQDASQTPMIQPQLLLKRHRGDRPITHDATTKRTAALQNDTHFKPFGSRQPHD